MDYEIKDPEIEKTFIISTAHITPEDAKKLSDSKRCLSVSDDFSCKIHLESFNDDRQPYVMAGLSQAFFNVMDAANELDCIRINFDGDGPTYENIPQFEW